MQNRDVVLRLGGHDLSGSLAAIGKKDVDLDGTVHHVEGGQDVSALVDHHATAHSDPVIIQDVFSPGLD